MTGFPCSDRAALAAPPFRRYYPLLAECVTRVKQPSGFIKKLERCPSPPRCLLPHLTLGQGGPLSRSSAGYPPLRQQQTSRAPLRRRPRWIACAQQFWTRQGKSA